MFLGRSLFVSLTSSYQRIPIQGTLYHF